jgi:hypothetical protein
MGLEHISYVPATRNQIDVSAQTTIPTNYFMLKSSRIGEEGLEPCFGLGILLIIGTIAAVRETSKTFIPLYRKAKDFLRDINYREFF